MNKEKITITEIVDLMTTKNNFSKKQTEEFVKTLLSTIEDTLIEGEPVKIKDFGTFKPQWNEPRKSVDVNTGDEIIIAGYFKAIFTPESNLKELVNKPFSHLESIEQSIVSQEKSKDASSELEIIAVGPMRAFEEQATQIKGILYEIEAMSGKQKETRLAQFETNNGNIEI
ncbi:MAG: HU family DNA-binding protein [Paludibacteraceae bacterium]